MWIEPEHHEWRWVILILILTALISSLPLLARQPSRNLTEDAFLYAQPSRRGTILGLLKKGAHLRVIGRFNGSNGTWLKVRIQKDGNIGWINQEVASDD